MKILELFSGTESFSKVARARGHECFTVDNDPQFKPDLCKDIMDLKVVDIPFKPDVIWASPPCQTFSMASVYRHWNKDRTPKTLQCIKAIATVNHLLKIIKDLNPKFYVIENPRAMLRKQEFMQHLPRVTVSYCQYGDKVMKPTDLFTNVPIEPRLCGPGRPCHESAKRGSDRGTQNQNRSPMKRVIVPPQLCKEIIIACEESK